MKKLIYIFSILMGLAACSSGHNPDASRLFNDADKAVTSGEYKQALSLIDSLNDAFPGELELRKRANFLRARAIEGLYNDSIAITDSLIIEAGIARDSLAREMQWVNNEIEGYFIVLPSTADDALSVRMSPEKVMYLVVNTSGNPSSMTFTGPDGTAISIPVSGDAYLNNTDGHHRSITVMGNRANEVAAMAAADPGAEIRLNGKPLGEQRCRALANSFNLMQAESKLLKLIPARKRMENVIETAKRQAARTVSDTIANQ